jgi:hypothetical protein
MTLLRSFPHRWLDPIAPLERDPQHRYRLGNHVFQTSVTGVLSSQKGRYARKQIEATRGDWERRGVTVHRALELAATVPGWHPDDWPACWPWIDWIWPMLSHPLWGEAVLCASEMGLYSLDLNIAGTFDGAYLAPRAGGGWHRILFDLKTQGRPDAGCYDTRPQLGGYLTLAREHGITFDGAAAIWARPGRARVTTYGVDECTEAWEAALAAYRGTEAQVERARAAGVLCASGENPFAL